MHVQSMYVQFARTCNVRAHVNSIIHTPHMILPWNNVVHGVRYLTHQQTCQVLNTPMTC